MVILCHSTLFANMGALLLLPQDDNTIDGSSYTFVHTTPMIGSFIGVENSYYRFGLSYDINNDKDVRLERLLINFDFTLSKEKGLNPLIGVAIGATTSKYYINQKKIKQNNGVYVLRVGGQYILDNLNNIDILIEYSHLNTNNIGKSYLQNDVFTTYNIVKKNDILLRIGYNFVF